MAEKETQAAKRLAKRLTALRATLRKDEREILDRMVTGKSQNDSEVQGHAMVTGVTAGAVAGVTFTVTGAVYTVVTA